MDLAFRRFYIRLSTSNEISPRLPKGRRFRQGAGTSDLTNIIASKGVVHQDLAELALCFDIVDVEACALALERMQERPAKDSTSTTCVHNCLSKPVGPAFNCRGCRFTTIEKVANKTFVKIQLATRMLSWRLAHNVLVFRKSVGSKCEKT